MRVERGKYKGMSEKEVIELLKKEGFSRVYVWEDSPGSFYPDHTHSYLSAHIVIEGKIKIRTKEGEFVFEKGDRFDVDEGEVHSAEIGEEGCRYVIGEK